MIKISYQHLVGLSIFLLFATSLAIPNGLTLSALFLVICGALYLATNKVDFSLTKVEIWLVVSMISYPIMIITNMLFHQNWQWSEFDYPVRYWAAVVVFFAVRSINPDSKYLFIGAGLGAISAGIGALYQTEVQYIVRAYGFAGAQRISFSYISLLCGMLAICGYKPLYNLGKWRLLIFIAVIGAVYASAMSGSRGGWIALPMYIWVLMYLSPESNFKSKLLALSSAGLIAIGIYFSSDFIQWRVNAIFPSLYNYFDSLTVSGSASVRLEMWRASWLMFSESPVFGLGMGTFASALQQQINAGVINGVVSSQLNPHNELFNIISEAGVVGALFTYLPYIAFFKLCSQHLKTQTPLAVAGLIFIIAHLDVGLSFSVMTLSMTSTMWVIGLAVIAGMLSSPVSIKGN